MAVYIRFLRSCSGGIFAPRNLWVLLGICLVGWAMLCWSEMLKLQKNLTLFKYTFFINYSSIQYARAHVENVPISLTAERLMSSKRIVFVNTTRGRSTDCQDNALNEDPSTSATFRLKRNRKTAQHEKRWAICRKDIVHSSLSPAPCHMPMFINFLGEFWPTLMWSSKNDSLFR